MSNTNDSGLKIKRRNTKKNKNMIRRTKIHERERQILNITQGSLLNRSQQLISKAQVTTEIKHQEKLAIPSEQPKKM